jgi:hypothetical protein
MTTTTTTTILKTILETKLWCLSRLLKEEETASVGGF